MKPETLNDMINVAELLKDARKGMTLYSLVHGKVEFEEVMDTDYVPIRVMKRGYGLRFDEYGRFMGDEYPDSECILFPSKDCRTWEGWKPPVKPKFKVADWIVRNNGSSDVPIQVYGLKKDRYLVTNMLGSKGEVMLTCQDKWRLWAIQDAKDGDIFVTTKVRSCPFIYRKTSYNNNLAYYYAGIDGNGNFCEGCLKRTLFHFGSVENVVPATKEQRDLLFAKMKEAGYEWDADKKELRKIHPHYDIANFHAGMPVLVRDNNKEWRFVPFSHITNGSWKFNAVGTIWEQCIPFEGNEHLLGTTDMPDECYINW